jgi:hypothetical protein
MTTGAQVNLAAEFTCMPPAGQVSPAGGHCLGKMAKTSQRNNRATFHSRRDDEGDWAHTPLVMKLIENDAAPLFSAGFAPQSGLLYNTQ